MANNVVKILTEFISYERNRFSDRYNNMFAFSFGQTIRYYEFLRIIFERYQKDSNDFIKNTKNIQRTTQSGTNKVTRKQMMLFNVGRRLSAILHLDIESFYLFSKILLDKMARAIEYYFGQVNKRPLDSHDDLSKNFKIYCSVKELNWEQIFLDKIVKLKKYVSDYRDHEIAHEKSPRSLKMTIFDSEGNTRLASSRLYPTKKDTQVEGKNLRDLFDEIDDYILSAIGFIKNNRTKTKLDLDL